MTRSNHCHHTHYVPLTTQLKLFKNPAEQINLQLKIMFTIGRNECGIGQVDHCCSKHIFSSG